MSIRAKLTIAFLLLIVVLGGGLFVAATHLVGSAWEQAKQQDLRTFVHDEANELTAWFLRKTQEVSALSRYSGFRTNNPLRVQQTLQALRSPLNGLVTEKVVIVLDQYGGILYSEQIIPPNSPLRHQLQTALQHLKESGGVYATTFLPASNDETPKLFIAAARWSDRGAFLGTMSALIDFSTSRMGTILGSLKMPAGARITLFDSSGAVLFRSAGEEDTTNDALTWMATKSVGKYESTTHLDGLLLATARVPELGWILTIRQSADELQAEIRRTQRTVLGIGLIGMALALVFAFLLARSLANPIEQLIQKTRELKEGSFVPLQQDASGELGALVQSFNEMATSLQKGRRKLQVLNELGEAIISDIRLNNILERICNQVADTMEVESCSIYLIDDDNVLRIKASIGLTEEERQELQFKIGEGITGQVFQEKKGMIVNDLAHDPRAKYIPHRRAARKLLSLPLLIRETPRGVMNIHNKKDGSDFTKDDLDLLNIFANQTTVAIENFRLFREVSRELQRVTELQTQLIQSEKLSAIGQLVAGVAHEINNPLGIILGYAELLQRQTNDPSAQKSLKAIRQATMRAASIVKNLLTFARKQEPNLVAVNVNDVIRSVTELLQHQLKVNNILLFTDFDESIDPVKADIQQLQQVFFNLLTNAMQAMEGMKDGRIVIETRQHNGTVAISVTDNGPGIKAEHLTKLFEPFFTTKPLGKGTGLGLSICYGIIKEFGGEITVTSAPGKGATFVVELPVMQQKTEFAQAKSESSTGTAFMLPYSVLVVEDEESLRLLLKDILESYGCRVQMAAGGEEALQLLSTQEFDIIISDYKMPGMNGRELYEACVREFPAYAHRFIFSTGDIITGETQEFFKSLGPRLIHKPFAVQEILHKIRAVASHPSSPT